MTNTYHAAHFDPTVDEIDVLKRLEMGELITQDGALKEHLSGRLLEWGLISKKADGEMAITPQVRHLVVGQFDGAAALQQQTAGCQGGSTQCCANG